jgi:hypothetical protein
MHSTLKSLVRAITAAGVLSLMGGAAAVSASASGSTTGTVHVWVTPGKGAVDKILLTGVIGDHGTATSINKDGTVNANGEYVKVALQKGGFEVNAVAFNTRLQKLQPSLNAATCTAWATGSGPVTLFDGTGAYAGIGGTVTMTTSFAEIGPRFATGPKKAQCNMSNNAQPVSEFMGDITGSGTISF